MDFLCFYFPLFCIHWLMDNDILLFRFGLHNRSQIGYTIDFIRFYIQDAKKRKKTAVQQLEQQLSLIHI